MRPRFTTRAVFWLAVVQLVTWLVIVHLYTQSRATIADHERQLEATCATTTTLDLALVVPLQNEIELTLRALPRGPQRQRLTVFRDNLRVAHRALAETQVCAELR